MALVIVETTFKQPITPEMIEEADARGLPCLEARDSHWRYSLLSTDRCRMICTFDAPDAESVRLAYRMADLVFDRIWPAEIRTPEETQPSWQEPILKVFEGTYPPFTDEDWSEANRHILPCYAQGGVEWVRSYISLDRTRVVCELNAPDAEVIRNAHYKFGIPFDRVWSANVLKPNPA